MSGLVLLQERLGASHLDASVLMPLFNSASMVAEAIESVLTQKDCVLDVLLSDDGSSDGTLERARAVLDAYDGPHRVRLFRVASHLGIDHLSALVDEASCRLLIEAHGDDVSYPGRMRRLLQIYGETGAALIVSLSDRRDEATRSVKPERAPAGFSTGWLSLAQTVPPEGSGLLAGARYALDRVAHDRFPRLESAHAPSSHDRIQAFRAALMGRLWFTEERLLLCRRHQGQGSRGLLDRRSPLTMRFGWSLRHLAAIRAMREDSGHAQREGLIERSAARGIEKLLAERVKQLRADLLDSRDELVRAGLQPLWVTQEEMIAWNAAARPAKSPPRGEGEDR